MSNKETQGINVLSIDGSLNGVAALHILQELLSRLEWDLEEDEELRPCDYFDAIAGSGTGGLIALLLGKLKMKASDAIDLYEGLASVFTVQSTQEEGQKAKNNETLETTLHQLLEKADLTPDNPMVSSENQSPKTVVYTLNAANMSTLYPIRNYPIRGSTQPKCTILQAGCAAVASLDKFLPPSIGTGHKKLLLADASMGLVNPTSELLRELQRAFSGNTRVSTIVSIGVSTGGPRVAFREYDGQLLSRVMANPNSVHEELLARLQRTETYYRLSVDLDADSAPDAVYGIVSAYLEGNQVNSLLDDIVSSVQRRESGSSLQDINSVSPVEIMLKPRPSVARDFVGRDIVLGLMRSTHFDTQSNDRSSPIITILTGLGGSGKTQIALKFGLEYERRYPNAGVYFIDASKEASLRIDLETIIRSQGSRFRTSTYEESIAWFATRTEKWLLILDNADDPYLKLSPYLPSSPCGDIIITTRDATRKLLAPRNTHVIEGLESSDAVAFLLEASGYDTTPANQMNAERIVQELGHLPLALAHAAAYISIHQCLSTFASSYIKSQTKLLEQAPDIIQSHSQSVAATIQMSLDRLSPAARNILLLFSHLDSGSIPYVIIVKAIENRFAPQFEDSLQLSSGSDLIENHAKTLKHLFCPTGEWVEFDFDQIIAECLQYSLLRVSTMNGERFYSMHVLVQTYLHQLDMSIDGYSAERLVHRLLSSAITIRARYENLPINRLLLPHIRKVKFDAVVEAGDSYAFGYVLEEAGEEEWASFHLNCCLRRWGMVANLEVLNAMMILSHCYTAMGRVQEALLLDERVFANYKSLLNEDHQETLRAMSNLSSSYSAAGREHEALALMEKVVERRRALLGDDNIDTVNATYNLALSYSATGREEEAVVLKEMVVARYQQLVGEDNPDTIAAKHSLAVSYAAMERHQEVVVIQEQVVAQSRRLLGEEHRETITAIVNLALSYSVLGEAERAQALVQEVLEKRDRLDQKHRDILPPLRYLLATLKYNIADAVMKELVNGILGLHEALLGPNHADTAKFKQLSSSVSWRSARIPSRRRKQTARRSVTKNRPKPMPPAQLINSEFSYKILL